jgi:hypothetical protein
MLKMRSSFFSHHKSDLLPDDKKGMFFSENPFHLAGKAAALQIHPEYAHIYKASSCPVTVLQNCDI